VDANLCTRSVANKIAVCVLWEFTKAFKEIIWQSRCEHMINWEKAANITTRDKRTSNRTPHTAHNHHPQNNFHDTEQYLDAPICYDDPPVTSGVPINNPRPPSPTRIQRLVTALKHVPCQINALVHHNILNSWVFKAKECFNKIVITT